MTPAVSVIMPVHNGAEWLAEAVSSVRAQDFGDFELIIVDDGSDDGTAAMLSGIAAADRRIRLLHQLPQGIVAALNKAIAEARAPYLARLDADDRARPDRLGKQFTFMQAHPEIGLLGTFAERIDAAGNVVGRLAPPTDPARLARVLARTNPFVHSSVMMRTALVRRIGGYRAAFRAAEDYDLWLRLAEAALPTCRGATRYGNRSRCGLRSDRPRAGAAAPAIRPIPSRRRRIGGRGKPRRRFLPMTSVSTACSMRMRWTARSTFGRRGTGCSGSITSSAASRKCDCGRCCARWGRRSARSTCGSRC